MLFSLSLNAPLFRRSNRIPLVGRAATWKFRGFVSRIFNVSAFDNA